MDETQLFQQGLKSRQGNPENKSGKQFQEWGKNSNLRKSCKQLRQGK